MTFKELDDYLLSKQGAAFDYPFDMDAQFDPPHEKLAYEVKEDEFDLSGNYAQPLAEVIEALQTYKSYEEMVCHFPDIKSKEEI